MFSARRSLASRLWPSIALILLLQFPVVAAEKDAVAAKEPAGWPQFLGPERNGISSESGLIDEWPAGGPEVVWRAPVGEGMSGVAIQNGRLVTLGQSESKQEVVCLDAKTGQELWRTAVAPAYRNGQGDGPRATPAIADDTVFAFTGEGILVALSLRDGSSAWQHNVVTEQDGSVANYGMASSPLIAGDLVVVTAGAPDAAVVAYRRDSGKLVWKSGNAAAGYSSAALINVGKQPHLAVFTGESLLGLDPATGRILWQYPFETDFACNIATPIGDDGRIFISSGENHGCALLAIESAGSKFVVQELWTSLGPKSVMRNGWQTCIRLGGYLYGYDNVGAAGPIMHLNCLDLNTGKLVWQEPRFGKGNCIAADGKLFCSSMNGELIVVRATPDKFVEIGRQKVFAAGSRQAPALANGLLYLRDAEQVTCIDVRKH